MADFQGSKSERVSAEETDLLMVKVQSLCV